MGALEQAERGLPLAEHERDAGEFPGWCAFVLHPAQHGQRLRPQLRAVHRLADDRGGFRSGVADAPRPLLRQLRVRATSMPSRSAFVTPMSGVAVFVFLLRTRSRYAVRASSQRPADGQRPRVVRGPPVLDSGSSSRACRLAASDSSARPV
jgi:hypothetical protein